MEKVINLGIPHVGENIFENIDTEELLQCLLVSQTWKILAESVLVKRWKSKIFEACKNGKAKILQLILEHSELNTKDLIIELNVRDEYGGTALIWACALQ